MAGSDGLFVAVEGVDHAGKTTLVAALTEALVARGVSVAVRKEPSTGPVGVFFRAMSASGPLVPYAMALLSAADRHEQQGEIARQMTNKQILVSDRYYLSGLAYHAADGTGADWYQQLNQHVIRPDLYLFLDVSPEVAVARGGDPDGHWEHADLNRRLPDAYRRALDLVTDTEGAHVIRIDANQQPDRVLADALTALSTKGIRP